jgi:ribosomal protein L24E
MLRVFLFGCIFCSPKVEYLAIITAYQPNNTTWTDNYKKRIKA